jgi:hypothetical protein
MKNDDINAPHQTYAILTNEQQTNVLKTCTAIPRLHKDTDNHLMQKLIATMSNFHAWSCKCNLPVTPIQFIQNKETELVIDALTDVLVSWKIPPPSIGAAGRSVSCAKRDKIILLKSHTDDSNDNKSINSRKPISVMKYMSKDGNQITAVA